MNGGGSERGRQESEAGSSLRAVSTEPNAGLELMDREIMTWAKVGGLTDWATQAPQEKIFLYLPLWLPSGIVCVGEAELTVSFPLSLVLELIGLLAFFIDYSLKNYFNV